MTHEAKWMDPEHGQGRAKCVALENTLDRVRLVVPESRGAGVRCMAPKHGKNTANYVTMRMDTAGSGRCIQ